MTQPKVFLRAEWKHLLIANYVCNPEILQKYLPAKTELDTFNGEHLVSLVAFRFLKTKVLGIQFPFHTNFTEVNLRFYVRYNDNGNWKRGVVFIKEIVPRTMITFIANTFYNENYETMSVSSKISTTNNELAVNYAWGLANSFSAVASAEKNQMPVGSLAEFITEHYWGYAAIDNYNTNEYAVEHPRWLVHQIKHYDIQANFESLYGSDFAFINQSQPHSVLLAEGSDVLVRKGKKLL
jgi:uncharacterized protein